VTAFSNSGKMEAAVKSGRIGTATAFPALRPFGELREFMAPANSKQLFYSFAIGGGGASSRDN
jgi:hypothetical protein